MRGNEWRRISGSGLVVESKASLCVMMSIHWRRVLIHRDSREKEREKAEHDRMRERESGGWLCIDDRSGDDDDDNNDGDVDEHTLVVVVGLGMVVGYTEPRR